MLRLPSLDALDQGLAVRIWLSTAPADLRKGFDSLAALVREHLGHDPLSGHLFLFVGRGRDRIKLLYWDRDGYVVWYKRLEAGTFRLPAPKNNGASVELKASELAMLLAGIDLTSIRRRPRFVRGGASGSIHAAQNMKK
jgi:transposase